MSNPTSAQYALGVQVGRAVCDAFAEGATFDEVAETLRYTLALMERNQELGLTESQLATGAPAST